jgi:hypothetical protein
MVYAYMQVKDVVGVMKNNVDKVLERDSKLSDLDSRRGHSFNTNTDTTSI